MKYVAYYRVSTKEQGINGLGLDAQKKIVSDYIKPENIYKEFQEIESGKRDNRPVLKQALELCKEIDGTLVIAKLDRLSRNAHFTLMLMNSKVKFVCCDMPNANEFTISIMAVMAQQEREFISQRTKDALAIKKKQLALEGKTLGKSINLTDYSRQKSVERKKEIAQNNDNNIKARACIKLMNGMTLKQKADYLNENGFLTANGTKFRPMQVKRLMV